MIVEHFDRRTMAAMELALDKACQCCPGGGQHNLRKRIAQSIMQCAKHGNNSVDALTEAGKRALAQLQQHSERSVKRKSADLSARLAECPMGTDTKEECEIPSRTAVVHGTPWLDRPAVG